MTFIRITILIFFVAFCSQVWGQKAYKIQKKQKNRYEAYPNPYDFRPSGWLFDAGLTATFNPDGETSVSYSNTDSALQYNGVIRPGIQLNAGRYFSLKKGHKLIKYLDYNLGYKMLWNSETQKFTEGNGQIQNFSLDNLAHYVNGNLNFNNVISFNDYTFLQNTLGINVDYRFAQSVPESGTNATQQPDNFVVQIHYKLALGFMIDNDKALIPYIEIPVYNITPSQSNFSQLDYFNGSYQTIIVGARIMLFRLGQKDCPTAKGVGLDPNQKNGY